MFLIVSIIVSVCSIGVVTTSAATAAPTGLTLTNKIGYLHIQWNKVSGALNYKMEYRTSKTPNWRSVTTTQNYWNISNPQSGVKFDIRITSLSKQGYIGKTSNIVTITYVEAPKNIVLSNAVNNIQVTWSGVNGAYGYRVAYKPVNTLQGYWSYKTANGVSTTIPTKFAGVKYYVQIQSLGQSGYNSSYTGVKSICRLGRPKASGKADIQPKDGKSSARKDCYVKGFELKFSPTTGAVRYQIAWYLNGNPNGCFYTGAYVKKDWLHENVDTTANINEAARVWDGDIWYNDCFYINRNKSFDMNKAQLSAFQVRAISEDGSCSAWSQSFKISIPLTFITGVYKPYYDTKTGRTYY